MAEEKRPDSGDTSPPPSLGQFDTDWGADWESAFQSEEAEAPAEVSADFFAGPETATTSQDTQSAPPDSGSESLEQVLDGIPGQAAKKDPGRRIIPWASEAAAALLAFVRALPLIFRRDDTSPLRKSWQRFMALSPGRQLLVAGAVLLIVAGAAFVLRPGAEPEPAIIEAQSDPQFLLPPDPQALSPEELLPEATPAPPPTIPPAPEIVRRKWPFPGFLIPVSGKDGAEVALVQVDLTLLTQLPEGQELPLDQESLIRDQLYRFYLTQTPDKLRRYSLARGEMLRDLREWLNQQLPDLAVESISFDRYAIN